MFCENCGARNDASAVFCTNCGYRLTPDAAAEGTASIAAVPAFEPALEEADTGKQTRSRRRIGRGGWIGIIAGAVAVALVATYFILNVTVFSPTRFAESYVRDIAAGNYSQASAETTAPGAKSQRQLLTDTFKTSVRMKNPEIVSSSRTGTGSYTIQASYSLNGKKRTKSFTVSPSGRKAFLWQDWAVSSPLTEKISISVPADVAKVSVNGHAVKLTESMQVSADDSAAVYALPAYPGSYKVTVDGCGSRTIVSGAPTARFARPESTEKKDTAAKKAFDIGSINAIINSYSSANAAASVRLLDGTDGQTYGTNQGNARLVAAGFYTPLYMAAKSSGDAGAIATATNMMNTMSNDDANTLMEDDGINPTSWAPTSWAQNNGYANTVFNRGFGDTEANSFHDSFWENWTSTNDASGILSDLYRAGGTGLLHVNIAGEGISIPAGMTVNAHRGFIGNTYCIYAIVQVNGKHAAVAVMSQGLNNGADYSRPKEMVSKVLANVNDQLK